MYLGLPTLAMIKLTDEYASTYTRDSGKMGEIYFREWFESRKKGSKIA